jgi:hypothetical protein
MKSLRKEVVTAAPCRKPGPLGLNQQTVADEILKCPGQPGIAIYTMFIKCGALLPAFAGGYGVHVEPPAYNVT